jgi:hypothetical protein
MSNRACPKCGRKLDTEGELCSACAVPAGNPYASPVSSGPVAPRGFSLRLLFGVITVLCVAMAVGIVAPGLGIAIGVVVTPALVRASVVIKRLREEGVPLIFEDRVFALLKSAGLAFVTALAAAGAFCCVCAPLGLVASLLAPNWLIYVAFGVGAIAGIAVWILVFRRYWPPKVHVLRPRLKRLESTK